MLLGVSVSTIHSYIWRMVIVSLGWFNLLMWLMPSYSHAVMLVCHTSDFWVYTCSLYLVEYTQAYSLVTGMSSSCCTLAQQELTRPSLEQDMLMSGISLQHKFPILTLQMSALKCHDIFLWSDLYNYYYLGLYTMVSSPGKMWVSSSFLYLGCTFTNRYPQSLEVAFS